MAKPTDFPQSTTKWGGFPSKHVPGGEVADLPVWRNDGEVDKETGEPMPMLSVSCWTLTLEELAEIQEKGVVWVYVWGVHPPVGVNGLNPFIPRLVKEEEQRGDGDN